MDAAGAWMRRSGHLDSATASFADCNIDIA